MDEKDKEAIAKATEDVTKMADVTKAIDQKLDDVLKAQAHLEKSMIRTNEEEKEVGGKYGFLSAKMDVLKGKMAAVPYWDRKTTERFGQYLSMLKTKDVAGIKKAFGDNVQDNLSEWTPAEFRSELVRLQFVSSVMLPRVTIVPMSRDQALLPTATGGYTWGFVDKGAEMVDSKFTPNQIELNTAKGAGFAIVNNEDLTDPAYPVAPYVAAQLAEDAAKWIDGVILYGDADGGGATDGKFDGWAFASGVNNVPGETDASPTFAEFLTFGTLDAMIAYLDELTANGAEFFMSPQAWSAIRAIQSNVSDGKGGVIASGVPVMLPNGQWAYDYMGFPVNRTSRCLVTPTVSKVAAFLGNPKYIYVGDRMNLTIDVSEHFRFSSDQTCFRAKQRFAVTVGIPSALVKATFGAGA
jgi:HK97 family phage major capsid protein